MTTDDLLATAHSRRLPAPPRRRTIRLKAHLTQDEIACTLGISRAAVSRYESGDREPRRDIRAAYSSLLDQLRIGGAA